MGVRRPAHRHGSSLTAPSRWSGAYAEPFTLTVIADLEGVPESDHSPLPGPAVHGPRGCLAQAARVPLRAVLRVHRGPPARAPQRRAERSGHGDVPGRLDPRRQGCRTARGQPLCRRTGDDGPAALLRAPDARRAARPPRSGSGPTATASRTSSRRRCGWRARCARSSAWPACAPRSAGVEIPAGGTVMLVPGACNRDPRLFDDPATFDIDRPNARQHIAFGHGIHTCAGAPLARAEGRVTINRFLDRTTDITISRGASRSSGRPALRVSADVLPPGPPDASTSTSKQSD